MQMHAMSSGSKIIPGVVFWTACLAQPVHSSAGMLHFRVPLRGSGVPVAGASLGNSPLVLEGEGTELIRSRLTAVPLAPCSKCFRCPLGFFSLLQKFAMKKSQIHFLS